MAFHLTACEEEGKFIPLRIVSADIVTYENELLAIYLVLLFGFLDFFLNNCLIYIDSDLLMKDYYLLQVAGNFHFAPGKSFQQSHVHGKVFSFSCLLLPFSFQVYLTIFFEYLWIAVHNNKSTASVRRTLLKFCYRGLEPS